MVVRKKRTLTAAGVTRETLEQTPARVMAFLFGVGTRPTVRADISTLGYTDAVHEDGWVRFKAVGNLSVEQRRLDEHVIGALTELDSSDELYYRLIGACLTPFPELKKVVLEGITPVVGPGAALNMGTMNYSKYSHKRKSFDFDMVFPNTYGKIVALLKVMNEVGVKPELECFDSGHTNGVWPLLDMGVLKPPLQFSFIVNVLGGIPGRVESLQLQQSLIPPGSEWEVIGISHGHWRMMAAALALGGNVRTGLEDHLYLPSGEMAASNGALVEVLVRMVRDTGRRPATVDEAKSILNLGAR